MQSPLEIAAVISRSSPSSCWKFTAGYRLASLAFCLLGFGCFADRADSHETPKPGEAPKLGEAHKVALFTGSTEHNPFWDLFADFMREAGGDLGIELEVFLAEGSPRKMASQIRTVCQRSNRPDAIVVQSFKRSGLNALRIAERFEMPVFLVNSGLTTEQKEEIGEPRVKLKHWIGEMLPDDRGAGFQLANALIDEALKDPQRLGPDGRVHLIGLKGVVSDDASIQRVAGLRDAVAKRSKEAVLKQVVAAEWEQDLAHKRCRILHRRFPSASVIWSASDWMAVGAIGAMRDLGLIPGRDVIIGGVDATPEAFGLIRQGTLHASIGGHFMEGGWVTVLLHDFFHDLDPARIPTRYLSPMTLVTGDNMEEYQAALERSAWKLAEFHQLSLVHEPERASYRFGVSALAKVSGSPAVPSTPPRGKDSPKDDERARE